MPLKYFGTDGIRGKVGTIPMTPDWVVKLGWAVGSVFYGTGSNRIVIGKDTRNSGYMMESALEAGLSAAGVDVCLLGPIPTPGVAYLTKSINAVAGIVISASHNPYYDNGFKFFTSSGNKLSEKTEMEIESLIASPIEIVDPSHIGKAERFENGVNEYASHCKNSVSSSFSLKGLRIVIDAAHGAAYQIAPKIFSDLGAKVITIGVNPDGLNINEQVGSTYPAQLCDEVIKHKADLGIALDGDGDRVIMVNHKGQLVDGDMLTYIIAAGQQRKGILTGGVVGTVMSNLGLERALESLNIPFMRAQVGDRHVSQMLCENDWYLGGESSGHVICRHVLSTGDGIVTALHVLEILVESGLCLLDLYKDVHVCPQVMINVPVNNQSNITGNKNIIKALLRVESQLAGRGRVLLRPSGTEPLVRVMVEGENELEIGQRCKELADIVFAEAELI